MSESRMFRALDGFRLKEGFVPPGESFLMPDFVSDWTIERFIQMDVIEPVDIDIDMALDEVDDDGVVSIEPRRRGRPKGSRNRPKAGA